MQVHNMDVFDIATNECELNNISIENEELSDADLMEINGGLVFEAILGTVGATIDGLVTGALPGILAV